MNIAFTSILLFLIIAPGFIFKLSYNSTKLSIKHAELNLINELTQSIIPAFCIQVLVLFLVEHCLKYKVDFTLLGNLILGVDTPEIIAQNFVRIKQYIYPIFFYNLFTFLLSYLLGFGCRKLIRYFKLDRRFMYLRFSNKWHYIFTGECLEFPDVPDDYADISCITVDVLCKVNGKSILYIGEIFDYYIDAKGNLEAIHLRYPVRRALDQDHEVENKYYEIPSKFLVIPASDIININIRYFYTEEIEDNQEIEEENIIDVAEEGDLSMA